MISLKELVNLRGKHCYWCGIETVLPENGNKSSCDNSTTREHLIPKSLGGRNHPNNLVVACRLCNTNRSSTSERKFRQSTFLKHRLMYLHNPTPEMLRRRERNRRKNEKRKQRKFHRLYIRALFENVARDIEKQLGTPYLQLMQNWDSKVLV